MIQYRNIRISFGKKVIIKNCSISLKAGRVTLVHGPSGCGKTTLFYRLGLLNTDCDVVFEGDRIKNKDLIRREYMAFVMQNNELLDYLSVEENLIEYASLSGAKTSAGKRKALLELVNLDVPLDQKCSLLSLGERERLCIACALSKDPLLLLLDEPTASLDRANKIMIFELLQRIAAMGKYVVFSSHEKEASDYADEVYRIENGELIQEKTVDELTSCHKRHRFLANRFITEHIQHYADKNRYLILLTGFFLIMTVLSSAFVMTWYGNNLNETRRLLFETTMKYLYVTDGRNEGYLDSDLHEVSLQKGYPVFRINALCGGTIPIIPYYEETDYSDKIDTYLSTAEHGVLISFRAKELMNKTVALQQMMSFPILDETGVHEEVFKMRGVLKQGVRAYELSNNEIFLAVWHEDYEKYDYQSVIGRILYFETYEELEQARNDLIEEGYKVNDQAASYERVLDVTQEGQKFYIKVRTILLWISAFLITGIHIFGIHRRIREITVLRMNGVQANLIGRMLTMEQMPAYVIIFVLGIILSIIMDF